jgi:hypothetical protein
MSQSGTVSEIGDAEKDTVKRFWLHGFWRARLSRLQAQEIQANGKRNMLAL